MIATFISFQTIEIAYVEQVDTNKHIFLEESTPGVKTVVKDGIQLRAFFETMLTSKFEHKGQHKQEDKKCVEHMFVCLSAKSKKMTQPIFQAIHSTFEQELIYFNIDKAIYQGICFNRPVIQGNDICFGEGFSQLRPKEELRIAFCHGIGAGKDVQFIFVENNANQLKQLKKEGQNMVVAQFDFARFKECYDKAISNLLNCPKPEFSHQFKATLEKYPFACNYLSQLLKITKQPNIKHLQPFKTQKLTLRGFLSQFCVPSTYYNITPKSWISRSYSKQISSYVFHSLSDYQLYIARANKPREFTNQEEMEIKILTYYMGFLIEPKGFAVPHDKNTTLMKYSKIKAYENKKAILNIRPYIQGLQTMKQYHLKKEQYQEMFFKGTLFGRKVRGLGGIILFSWLINQNFNIKTLAQQLTMIEYDRQNEEVVFLNKQTVRTSKKDLYLCRTDYFMPLNMETFKILDQKIIVHKGKDFSFRVGLKQLNEGITQQICQLLNNITQQRQFMIKNLFIMYKWSCKLASFYDVVSYRLKAIRQYFEDIQFVPQHQGSLLFKYPQLACLMIPENYDIFMQANEKIYAPVSYQIQDRNYSISQSLALKKQAQNPYLTYLLKPCSFAIYKFQFPVLTFMQWIKSTNKYQIIEYMSMINHTLQEYMVMDKRLKLQMANDKKSVIFVVDHVELCQEVLRKNKSVKTVMVFRLKKAEEMDDFGLISENGQKMQSIQQSKDQLLSILSKWGTSSKFFASKFQLYDWILSQYSQIKCNLYALGIPGNMQFLQILHKAVSTNRHRHKELQAIHKDKCKYLYTFPILKQSSKIVLNYRLFQFMHMQMLFRNVSTDQWTGKLQTYQNASVKLWRQIIDADLATKMVRKLLLYLKEVAQKQIEGSQFRAQSADSLQLIQSLTELPSNMTTIEQPYSLYFQAFTELIKIQTYDKIEDTLLMGDTMVVIEEDNIEIMKGPQNLKISKEETNVLACQACENQLILLNYDLKAKQFYITALQITPFPMLGYSKIFSQMVQDKLLKKVLQQANWDLFKISKTHHSCVIAAAIENKVVITVFDVVSQKPIFMEERTLKENVRDLKFIRSQIEEIYLLAVTQSQIVKFYVEQQSIRQKHISLISVGDGIVNSLFEELQGELHIYLYKKRDIEHYIVVKHELKRRERLILKRTSKIMTVQNRLLYVFYQNCDVLDILAVKDGQLHKIWSYYWVQPNVQNLYIHGEDIYLRGNSYLKRVRIRNAEAVRCQMLRLGQGAQKQDKDKDE